MRDVKHHIALAIAGLALGAALVSLWGLPHAHQKQPAELPAVPPTGWTQVCVRDPMPICRTYPPGDERSEPSQPPIPFRRYNLPS